MQRSASRSQGSRTHPCAKFVRFTEKENERLNRLCRKRGLTVQTFVHAAAMRAISEAELGKKTDAEQVNGDEEREHAYQPRGLGLREHLRPSETVPREEIVERFIDPPTIPAAAPTLSRVLAADEVTVLARTIVESPASARREILKAAVRSLARGRSQEEAVQLAEDLDATIQRLDGDGDGGGGVPKTALERARARAAK